MPDFREVNCPHCGKIVAVPPPEKNYWYDRYEYLVELIAETGTKQQQMLGFLDGADYEIALDICGDENLSPSEKARDVINHLCLSKRDKYEIARAIWDEYRNYMNLDRPIGYHDFPEWCDTKGLEEGDV